MKRIAASARRAESFDVETAPSIGGGARRAIAWGALDVGALGVRGRRAIGATWRERMRQEHLAVGAFSLLARELAEVGCDSVVLSLITRAACDEVRHAEICQKFAIALLGAKDVPSSYRGLPKVPMHERASAATRVLFHVVEMCCLSETTTGVYFTEMLARATDPVAREAIESLLEDEIDHGRVGWAYVTQRVAARSVDGLAEALPAMLDRSFGAVLGGGGRVHADDAKLERCGFLGAEAAREVYARALWGVILPEFETVGVDVGAARKRAVERGWLALT